jgi:Right handed beta helix region
MKGQSIVRFILLVIVLSSMLTLIPAKQVHAARTVRVRFQDPTNCKVDQDCYNRNNLQQMIELLTNDPSYDPNDPPTLEVSGQFAEYEINVDSRIVITRSIRLIGINEGGKAVVIDGSNGFRPIRIIAPTNGEPFKVTVSGFTIKNGLASLNEPVDGRYFGGAVYIKNAPASVVISNNVFLNNAAGDTNNTDTFGGAIAIRGGTPQIRGNIFQGNHAAINRSGRCCPRRGHGGAIALSDSSAVIANNLFRDNVAGVRQGIAGAIYLNGGSGTQITGNTLLGNTASNDTSYSPNIAGGLYAYSVTNLTISNNIIAYNRDVEGAGGMLLDGTTASLMHNTFANNIENGLRVRFSSPVIATNTLFANNIGWAAVADSNGAELTLQSTLYYQGSTTTVTNGGIITEQGSISGFDPLFAPGIFNYHISANSPARDAGITTAVTTDMEGDPRPIGSLPDIGADEFAYRAMLPLTIRP